MARIEKRENSWRFTVSLGYDEKRRQIRKTKTIPAEGITKIEARRLANEFENECRKKSFINDRDLTLEGFVEYWRHEYERQEGNYSPQTIERNEVLLKRIIPALGHIRLSKLKPTHLVKFYNNLREDGMRMDGRPGKLSSRTIQMHHKLLSAILNKAKRWQFITSSPAEYIDPPKSKSKKTEIYDEATLLRFFQILFEKASPKYQAFFLIAFSTGLRRGEITGLRWKDIDLDKKVLYVNQTIAIVKGGTVFKDPKTKASVAGVSISESVIPVLEKLKKENSEMKKIVTNRGKKEEWNKEDLVFIGREGKRMYPSSFRHWLSSFCKKNDLPEITVHAFRHMSVTYAIDQGFDIKAVSARARHTQVSTTTDIYGHYLPQKDQAIAKSLDKIIASGRGRE